MAYSKGESYGIIDQTIESKIETENRTTDTP